MVDTDSMFVAMQSPERETTEVRGLANRALVEKSLCANSEGYGPSWRNCLILSVKWSATRISACATDLHN